MSRYDGLIIPRGYNDYISKTDAATLLQALQLSGVMDNAPIAGSNHPVKSSGLVPADTVTSGDNRAVSAAAVKNYALEMLYEGRPSSNGTNVGINVNAGGLGKTLLVIGSCQWDAGNATGSAVYMLRCGFDGNIFNKTIVAEDNINTSFQLSFSVDETGNLIVTAPVSVWYIKIIGNR